jgi:hypothetical protein
MRECENRDFNSKLESFNFLKKPMDKKLIYCSCLDLVWEDL